MLKRGTARVWGLLTVLVLLGCEREQTGLLAPDEPSRTDSRSDTYGETYMGTAVSDSDLSNIQWAGESSDELDGSYECPPFVDRPHFTHKGYHFQHEHRAYLVAIVGQIGSTPKGRYHLATSTVSDDGTMELGPGDLEGTCWTRRVRVYSPIFGWTTAWVGVISWYRFYGTMTPTNGYPGGFGGRGWAWHNSGSGYSNGEGGDWQSVLQAYLTSGTCTPGWEIWMDGRMVCNSRGQAV